MDIQTQHFRDSDQRRQTSPTVSPPSRGPAASRAGLGSLYGGGPLEFLSGISGYGLGVLMRPLDGDIASPF